jgi:hypothetical protein
MTCRCVFYKDYELRWQTIRKLPSGSLMVKVMVLLIWF